MDINASYCYLLDALGRALQSLRFARPGPFAGCSDDLDLITRHPLLFELRTKARARIRSSDSDAQLCCGLRSGELKAMSWLQVTVDTESELDLSGSGIPVDQQLGRHIKMQVLRGNLSHTQHFDLSHSVITRFDELVESLNRQSVQVNARVLLRRKQLQTSLLRISLLDKTRARVCLRIPHKSIERDVELSKNRLNSSKIAGSLKAERGKPKSSRTFACEIVGANLVGYSGYNLLTL
ncbi:hypothetical protein C8K36_106223 [Rhodococcus sp. OK519]|nr:hypothetical protein C8K36_106223 [Rhodococcus sp. OK519]